MLVISKTLVLLMIELGSEYLFGTMVTKLILKRESNPLMSLQMGFMSYQALFQVVALTFIFSTGVLHHLTMAWGIIVFITVSVSIFVGKDTVKQQIKNGIWCFKQYKIPSVLALIVIVMFCYYVSVNGENNEDARYYIGLMTTSVDTDTMFQYNVYNGYQTESLYLRRAFVTFEIQSAVISQMFGIHPLIIARIFRACQNVILTSSMVFLCAEQFFGKAEVCAYEMAMGTVIVFWPLQLMFANTIYTPAMFVLYRAYEAKAFTSNFIVLLGLYLAVKTVRDENIGMWLLLVVFLWGSIAISTSAFVVAAAECGVILISLYAQKWIMKKKQEKLYAS